MNLRPAFVVVATCMSTRAVAYKQHQLVTCHDGFTLYDLFSYNKNITKLTAKITGMDATIISVTIAALKAIPKTQAFWDYAENRQKMFFLSCYLARDSMLLAGDEILHTQHGNNNCYCQDNELSWIDWNMTNQNADMLRFVKQMIALRKRHPSIMRRRFLTGGVIEGKNMADVSWHGTEINKPLWNNPDARILAFTLAVLKTMKRICISQ